MFQCRESLAPVGPNAVRHHQRELSVETYVDSYSCDPFPCELFGDSRDPENMLCVKWHVRPWSQLSEPRIGGLLFLVLQTAISAVREGKRIQRGGNEVWQRTGSSPCQL